MPTAENKYFTPYIKQLRFRNL